MNEIQLAQAVALLTDTILVLDRDKVSPPLQGRIATFLQTIDTDRMDSLLRLANDHLPFHQAAQLFRSKGIDHEQTHS